MPAQMTSAAARARWMATAENDDRRTIALAKAIGFTSLAAGVASGLVLGLWSFAGPLEVPDALGDYASLPRRLVRLGHIAFVGLGLITLCLAGHVGSWDLARGAKRAALGLGVFGNVVLPVALIMVAFRPDLALLLAPPALAIFAALAVAAFGAWRHWSRVDNHAAQEAS